VIDNQIAAGTPAVHALVIGVGRYQDPLLPPLPSAVQSALAFADWIRTKHSGPGQKLGSLVVLASDPGGAPVRIGPTQLDPPTSTNVKEAIDGWHNRAATDANNAAVFYFCGHGVELGAVQSLMLEDVKLDGADPFDNALAFDDFLRGMDSCGARLQLFVIDACRDLPAALARLDDDVSMGRAFVRFDFKKRAKMQPRKFAILQAAAATQKAWAGKSSGWFTENLLSVLDGAASDNKFSSSVNDYFVNTKDIAETITFLVKHNYIDPPAGPQTPMRRGEGDFDFHAPAEPKVPVVVTRAAASNAGATFRAECNGIVHQHTCPDVLPWRAQLRIGAYEFKRDAEAPVPFKIGPPAKRVELP
jgi:hypothetical protein